MDAIEPEITCIPTVHPLSKSVVYWSITSENPFSNKTELRQEVKVSTVNQKIWVPFLDTIRWNERTNFCNCLLTSECMHLCKHSNPNMINKENKNECEKIIIHLKGRSKSSPEINMDVTDPWFCTLSRPLTLLHVVRPTSPIWPWIPSSRWHPVILLTAWLTQAGSVGPRLWSSWERCRTRQHFQGHSPAWYGRPAGHPSARPGAEA